MAELRDTLLKDIIFELTGIGSIDDNNLLSIALNNAKARRIQNQNDKEREAERIVDAIHDLIADFRGGCE